MAQKTGKPGQTAKSTFDRVMPELATYRLAENFYLNDLVVLFAFAQVDPYISSNEEIKQGQFKARKQGPSIYILIEYFKDNKIANLDGEDEYNTFFDEISTKVEMLEGKSLNLLRNTDKKNRPTMRQATEFVFANGRHPAFLVKNFKAYKSSTLDDSIFLDMGPYMEIYDRTRNDVYLKK
jgi:hypothetical protein